MMLTSQVFLKQVFKKICNYFISIIINYNYWNTKMPYIKVLVPVISIETKKKVLDFYNVNKEKDEAPLQSLDRAEGEFKIDLPENQWKKDYLGYTGSNEKIRQKRWSKERLDSCGFRGFTLKQYMLLYEALVFSLEPGTVILEE